MYFNLQIDFLLGPKLVSVPKYFCVYDSRSVTSANNELIGVILLDEKAVYIGVDLP